MSHPHFLRSLEQVDLRDNNLMSPPQMIADEGTDAIVKYLDKGTDLGLEQPHIEVSTCGMGWWFLVLGVAFYFSDLFSDILIISQLYSLSYVDRSNAAVAALAGAGNSSSYIEATFNASVARELKCQGNVSFGKEALHEDTLYYSYEFLFYASILSVLAPPIYIAIFQDAIFFERLLSLSIFLKVPYETYMSLVTGKSSRTLFAMKVSEVVLESVPQLMIQIYMLLPALANAEPLQTALIFSISSALFNTTATFVSARA